MAPPLAPSRMVMDVARGRRLILDDGAVVVVGVPIGVNGAVVV